MARQLFPMALLALVTPCAICAQGGTVPEVPRDIAAALERHLGKWRSDVTLVTNGLTTNGTANWECAAAVGGIGLVCTWLHEWAGGLRDRAVDLIGYDPASGALMATRVTDRGIASSGRIAVRGDTLVRRWEGTQDDKPLVGLNEVYMTPGDGGDWTQRVSVRVDGETVMEMRITHHRVR